MTDQLLDATGEVFVLACGYATEGCEFVERRARTGDEVRNHAEAREATARVERHMLDCPYRVAPSAA